MEIGIRGQNANFFLATELQQRDFKPFEPNSSAAVQKII